MTGLKKKRVHFSLSIEALMRLDEVVKVANESTIRRGQINRSDIVEKIILKNTRNKLEVIEEKIREHSTEINRLQKYRRDLEDKAEQTRIKVIEKEKIAISSRT